MLLIQPNNLKNYNGWQKTKYFDNDFAFSNLEDDSEDTLEVCYS